MAKNVGRSYRCYNCGAADHFSRNCPEKQENTRCPSCHNVARTPAGHKLDCPRQFDWTSKRIGSYELPYMDYQNISFAFKNISNIYISEETMTGVQNFMITKFLSVGTNVKFRRIYSQGNEVHIQMKLKPSISLSIGRLNKKVPMASLYMGHNQVRVNHFYTIDEEGRVQYSLMDKQRKDQKHDVEMKFTSNDDVILFAICWQNKWQANIAMSETAITVGSSAEL